LLSGGFVAAKLIYFTSEGEKLESLRANDEASQRNVVAARLAQLGNEGWEMIATGITGQGSHAVYFKRRILSIEEPAR
jgi:hypothetical protein